MVRHKKICITSCWDCSFSIMTSVGAAWMTLTNKIASFLAGEKWNAWLYDAICHSSVSFFMSKCRGFSPHGTAVSPTASPSLLLWRWRHTWRFTSCLTKKCAASLQAPGTLAHDLVVEGGHLAAGCPGKVGPGPASTEGASTFREPHIQNSASTSDTVFLLSVIVILLFIRWRSQYPASARLLIPLDKGQGFLWGLQNMVECFRPNHVCKWQTERGHPKATHTHIIHTAKPHFLYSAWETIMRTSWSQSLIYVMLWV